MSLLLQGADMSYFVNECGSTQACGQLIDFQERDEAKDILRAWDRASKLSGKIRRVSHICADCASGIAFKLGRRSCLFWQQVNRHALPACDYVAELQ